MTVETAATSRDALALLAQGDLFDAVILDLQLPDKDGLALAEEIRKQPSGRYVPLLAAFLRPPAQRRRAPAAGRHLRVSSTSPSARRSCSTPCAAP